MQNAFSLRLFRVMFEEAHKYRPPSRERLSVLLDQSTEAVDLALAELERAGLVDARRARLTMCGLAVAAATRSARSPFLRLEALAA